MERPHGESCGRNIVMNLAEDLLRRAEEVPERIGLYFEDGRSWTFAQWAEQSGRLGAALTSLGVRRGDRVALFIPNSPELAFALYGCWRIGAVAVPMSSLYNAHELESSIAKTSPVLLIAHPDTADIARGSSFDGLRIASLGGAIESDVIDLDALAAATEPVIGAEADPGEAVILFTGGTTGLPKAAVMEHRGILDAVHTMTQASKGGSEGPYPAAAEGTPPNLVVWPLFHAGGQQPLLVALHAGRSVVLVRRFSVGIVAAMVERHHLDNVFLAPTMIYDLVATRDEIDLSGLRSVLSAGQRLDPELQRRFEERYGVPILQSYGSTETGHVAGWTGADLKAGRWKPGAVGRIYPGVEARIRDEDGNILATGETGELWVGTSVTSGYADSAESDLFDGQGFVRSGDMGWIDADGVLFLVGRRREMIKTGGFQVWPAEIEEVLRSHPLVADVAVVGARDERLGEIPLAFIVATCAPEEIPDDAVSSLIEHTRHRLAHFKAIRAVEFIDALPRSEAGKVARGELLERLTTS